jgi:2-iminoacetate synthase
MQTLPNWLDPTPWLSHEFCAAEVQRALCAESPDEASLAALLSPAAADFLEPMAARAQALTRRHFGNTVQLYVPLYLSSWCSGGCAYCGFAADRHADRHALDADSVERELSALKTMGFEEILLLTGERSPHADLAYLRDSVQRAARRFHNVTIEVFPMAEEEYRTLAEVGCTGVTLYQETYHPETYARMHRWGPKKDFFQRLDAPERALRGGLRFAGLGALLGLTDPRYDLLALYRHIRHLQKACWRAGLSASFPRLRSEVGGFTAPHPVSEQQLAQYIFAFRIVLPDVPLVLSTREGAAFRDGMAGLGISKMSIASKTTVGGYGTAGSQEGQFDVNDSRTLDEFCAMLRKKGLDPVFKNWDGVYRIDHT